MHIPLTLSQISSPFTRNRGRNKLNLLLFEEDWTSAITEIECHPNETKLWTTRPGFFDGEHESHVLPIHVACSLHAPVEVIRAIVRAYPNCIGVAESAFKRLPLHIACQFAARVDVIEFLTKEYSVGTMQADVLGRLPLHYACSNGAPLDVVKILMGANSSSVLWADYNGWVPLHVAVHFGATTEVVKTLTDQMPPKIVEITKTKKGSTALSLAKKVQTKNKEEVIQLLESVMGLSSNDSVADRSAHKMKPAEVPESSQLIDIDDCRSPQPQDEAPQIIDLLDCNIAADGSLSVAAASASASAVRFPHAA